MSSCSPAIACYLRVSSRTQKTDSQKTEIEQWLLRHGYDPSTVQGFEDKETGKTLKRPSFDHLQLPFSKAESKQFLFGNSIASHIGPRMASIRWQAGVSKECKSYR
ncbi:recombinase family protein [Trichocoleus sp. FACHB-262]|uniref:recombinase family protein n=1 Tax=Trichocoleus sp. FACHB-262 TaxID=2692869 RepID=UPI0018F02A15